MKIALSYNESHLIASILVGRMGYSKGMLFDDNGKGFNQLLAEDFTMFSVCHHLNELSDKVIKREDAKGNDFSGCIKSINEKFNKEVV